MNAATQIVFESALSMPSSKMQHEIGGGYEARLDAALRRLITDSHRQMTLPDARRSEHNDVLCASR